VSSCSYFTAKEQLEPVGSVGIGWVGDGDKDTLLAIRAGEGNKGALPAYIPTGVLDHRRGGTTPEERNFVPSGYGMLDIDGKAHPERDQTRDEDLVTTFARKAKREFEDAGFVACISPGGDGIKAIFRISGTDEDDDLDAHYAAAYHAAVVLAPDGYVVDSCGDLGRLCFQSHDPDMADPSGALEIVVTEYDRLASVRLRAAKVDWGDLGDLDEPLAEKALRGLLRPKESKFKTAYEGDASRFDGDVSAAIFSLISHLRSSSHKPGPQEIVSILLDAPLVTSNPKYDGDEAYMRRSVQNMIDKDAANIERKEVDGNGIFAGWDGTDATCAAALDRAMGQHLRFLPETGGWALLKDTGLWDVPLPGRRDAGAATEGSRALRDASSAIADEDTREAIQRYTGSMRNMEAALKHLGGGGGHDISLSEFDAQVNLIHIPDTGLLNLVDLTVRPPGPEDLVSSSLGVPWVKGARADPEYQRLTTPIFDDPEHYRFLMRYAGASLFGRNVVRSMIFGLGEGGHNGKSSLFSALVKMFGGYGADLPARMLFKGAFSRGGADHTADLANIPPPARLGYCDEEDGDGIWDIARIKRLCSEESIKVRGLGQDFRDAQIRFNMLASSNYLPPLEDYDPAILKRILVLRFEHTFSHDPAIRPYMATDKFLVPLLDDVIEGLRDYNEVGLDPPAAVIIEGEKLASDLDTLGSFLGAYTVTVDIHDEGFHTGADMWRCYRNHLENEGLPQIKKSMFMSGMKGKGYEQGKCDKVRAWKHRTAAKGEWLGLNSEGRALLGGMM